MSKGLRSRLSVVVPYVLVVILAAALAVASGPVLSGDNRADDDGATHALADPDPADDAHGVAVTLHDEERVATALPVAERDAALRAARAHEPIARLLAARHEVVLARAYDTTEDGDVDACAGDGCITLIAYVYPTNDVVSVVVERGAWRVARAGVDKGQPPLSPPEQARAHAIADADPDLRRHLAGATHSHPVPAYPMWRDAEPCDVDRCASVVYPLDGMIATGIGRQATVVVDLSTERIVERIYLRCAPACAPGWV